MTEPTPYRVDFAALKPGELARIIAAAKLRGVRLEVNRERTHMLIWADPPLELEPAQLTMRLDSGR